METLNRGALRVLLRQVGELASRECHLEARLKLAVAFDLFEIAKLLLHVGHIQALERKPHRYSLTYEGTLTQRILDHVERQHGAKVRDQIVTALNNHRE